MNKQPNWSVKPKHRKEVIATDMGWIVKDTGEILLRINGLVKKLEDYNKVQNIKDNVEVEVEVEKEVEVKKVNVSKARTSSRKKTPAKK